MSNVTINECDTCNVRVDNAYQEPGWIQIRGSFTRSVGRWMKASYGTAFIDGGDNCPKHFCSMACLVAKLDELNPVHIKPKQCLTCGALPPSSEEKL